MTIETVRLELTGGRSYYLPGEPVGGSVRWRIADRMREAALHLGWRIEGRGGPEAQTVAVIPFDLPRTEDERTFEFVLPAGPYSFSGRLFSLTWAIYLIFNGDLVALREEIVISPTRQPIVAAGPPTKG